MRRRSYEKKKDGEILKLIKSSYFINLILIKGCYTLNCNKGNLITELTQLPPFFYIVCKNDVFFALFYFKSVAEGYSDTFCAFYLFAVDGNAFELSRNLFERYRNGFAALDSYHTSVLLF